MSWWDQLGRTSNFFWDENHPTHCWSAKNTWTTVDLRHFCTNVYIRSTYCFPPYFCWVSCFIHVIRNRRISMMSKPTWLRNKRDRRWCAWCIFSAPFAMTALVHICVQAQLNDIILFFSSDGWWIQMEPAMILSDFHESFSDVSCHFFGTKNSIEKSQVTQWNTNGLKLVAASPPCHPLAVRFVVVFLGGMFPLWSFFSCRFLLVFLETSNFCQVRKSLRLTAGGQSWCQLPRGSVFIDGFIQGNMISPRSWDTFNLNLAIVAALYGWTTWVASYFLSGKGAIGMIPILCASDECLVNPASIRIWGVLGKVILFMFFSVYPRSQTQKITSSNER